MKKKERLQEAFDYLRFKGIIRTQSDVAERMGASRPNVSSALKGDTKVLTDSFIQRFARTFGISEDWLLTGEGSMLTPSPVTVTQSNVHGNNTYAGGNVVHGANALAAVGRDTAYCNRCGSTDVYYTCPAPKGAPVVPVTLNSAPGIDLLEYVRTHASVEQSNITVGGLRIDMFMFVRDASLEPRYCIGDLIALIAYPKGEENPIPGKIYAVDTYSNGLHLRILRNDDPRLEEGDYLARSFNPDKYPDYIIRKKDIIRIFKKVFTVKF